MTMMQSFPFPLEHMVLAVVILLATSVFFYYQAKAMAKAKAEAKVKAEADAKVAAAEAKIKAEAEAKAARVSFLSKCLRCCHDDSHVGVSCLLHEEIGLVNCSFPSCGSHPIMVFDMLPSLRIHLFLIFSLSSHFFSRCHCL